jgi:hypothetical protein
MFWRKEPQDDNKKVEQCALGLYEWLTKALTQNGRIHAEDLISAAAAIVGEISIEAGGDFNPRKHDFTPGQRVLSAKANVLFSGDTDISDAPADSIVGIFCEKLRTCGFQGADFPPSLKEIFSYFVANIGKAEDWGKVPLSVPKDHLPFMMPLRAAYESRAAVDKLFAPLAGDTKLRLRAATLALAETLCQTRDVLDRKVAITLALETVNGMSKTAPMTDAAMAKLKSGQKS